MTIALLVGGSSAWAQVVQDNLWVTDGNVNAVVREGNTVYIGGNFTRVSPITGTGANLDITTGIADGSFPRIDGGIVFAVVSDGLGGWYIGGEFTSVGGIARNRIAHIKPDKTVDLMWNPNASGRVATLAVSGTTVYAGGDFTTIDGQARNAIAALDATSGAATAWDPNANGNVNALAVDGTTVYAGGFFTSIGGQPRNRIAALDVATGVATAWNPNASGIVNALAVSGTTVYAGGQFTAIGGQPRNFIAALNNTGGAATAWNPNADNSVRTLAVDGTTVYAGGQFTSIGGAGRLYIAALNAASGNATAWNPAANGFVNAFAVSGSTVYVGGAFTSIGGAFRNRIAALDALTNINNATAWDPDAGSQQVFTLALSGSTIYAGGVFTTIGGQPRNCIAALDATTGVATAWNPDANSDVFALAVSGGTVYVGGDFTTIGGQSRNRIAALNNTNGNATAWDPDANAFVSALAVSGTTVYAGGGFGSIGGQGRNRIAALDADLNTNNATPWDPNANNNVAALAVSGSTVYAGGQFTFISGQARNRIAALNATSGLATAWNPDANNQLFALTVSGGTVYAGGFFTDIGGQARNRIAALDATSGAATAWDPNANNTVFALAVSGTTVYAGGQFTTIGGQPRSCIAALNATVNTNNALTWNPGAGSDVSALAVSGNTVYAGGFFNTIGGQSRIGIAALSAVPPPTTFVPAVIPGGTTYNDVVGTASGAFITVGNGGQIRYTTNNGSTWLTKTSGTSNTLLGIAVANNFNPALVTSRGASTVQAPTAFGTAISCGVGGTILRTTTGGDSWINENDAIVPDVELRSVAVADVFGLNAKGANVSAPTAFGTAISCGVGGTILRSTDGGENWTVENSSGADLNSVAVTNDFSTAARKGASGTQASHSRAGVQSPTAFGTAISCGVGGTVLRSIDAGDTWTPVLTPTTNTLNSISIFGDASAARQTGKGASGVQASHSRAGVQSPTALGTAISCGVGGTILRSIDGGQSWTLLSSGTTEDLNAVQMATELVGYISGDNGTLLRTTDAGQTWQNLSPATTEEFNGIFVQPGTGIGITVGTNGVAFTTLNGGGGDNPLPVELTAFSGTATESSVNLNWTTASEKNNAGFVLLRNGISIADYASVATLEGKGTTSATTQYGFTDATVEAGRTYSYTLRSVDYSGTTHDYPQSVTVEVRGAAGQVYEYALMQNYPNPFNPATVIGFTMKNAGVAAIKIYDVLGRVVVSERLNATAGVNQYRFNGSRLTSGVYFYQLTVLGSLGSQAEFSQTRKMLLVK